MNDGTGSGAPGGGAEPEPLLRVVRGTPTAEELAALVAAVRTRRPAGRTESSVSARSGWVRITRPGVTAAGLPTERGPHAWRISTFPR